MTELAHLAPMADEPINRFDDVGKPSSAASHQHALARFPDRTCRSRFLLEISMHRVRRPAVHGQLSQKFPLVRGDNDRLLLCE